MNQANGLCFENVQPPLFLSRYLTSVTTMTFTLIGGGFFERRTGSNALKLFWSDILLFGFSEGLIE